MAADLSKLSNDFRPRVQTLLHRCEQEGVIMRPYFTIRHPVEQAGMWRQSRSAEEIAAKLSFFDHVGANFLAECMMKAGPKSGPHITNALPGESWHQWGEAVDCFWLVDGKANWSATEGGAKNGYVIMADIAKELELTPGGHWNKLKDWPHVQRFAQSVTDQYSWPEIDAEMRNRFDRVD